MSGPRLRVARRDRAALSARVLTAPWRACVRRDVDNVAEMMDQVNDGLALADELGEAMAQPIGALVDDVSGLAPRQRSLARAPG